MVLDRMMKLTALVMVRNEADILPDFLGHCAKLFNEVLVVDHSSTDGTSEMLAEASKHMSMTIWKLTQQAKVQSLVHTALAQEAYRRGADWVFPLDADEFPAVTGRADLHTRMEAVQEPLAKWQWCNAWPKLCDSFEICSISGEMQAVISPIRKVAVNRSLLSNPRLVITRGAHRVTPPAEGPVIGDLLHVPIRSTERFKLKLETHLAADKVHGDGIHYQILAQQLSKMDPGFDAEILRQLALGYPSFGTSGKKSIEFSILSSRMDLAAEARSFAEVQAREATVMWEKLPKVPSPLWRIRLHDGEARVVG
jgi:Glycosyl transferase family 2